jgi:hypothetical protein
MGTSTAWIYCAIYIFIYGSVIESNISSLSIYLIFPSPDATFFVFVFVLFL